MRIISRFQGLSVNNRIALCLKVGALSVILWMAVSGRPPASAQHGVVTTERVVTQTDEAQDLEISKLQEFKLNQENWNKQTGTAVDLLNTRTNEFWGGMSVIGALIAGSVGIQFRKRSA
jgi:hypothetical protein